jgi:thiol-disulfide isomerase/thioredoxin
VNPRRAAIAAALVTMLAVVAVVVALSVNAEKVLPASAAASQVRPAADSPTVPELVGVKDFDNTAPLTMQSLRGKVVLVDFWTYTCINCRRTFPFLSKLTSTYDSSGLVVLGVHSPEFGFEKDHGNVARAVKELGVTWPVAEDPNMDTWNAYSNQSWPADYLVDRNGKVRYGQIGEGRETDLENAVRALIAEGGTAPAERIGDVPTAEKPGDATSDLTPETYLGEERGSRYIGPKGIVTSGAQVTRNDGLQPRDTLSLKGSFTGGKEYLELNAGAAITQKFHAKDVYATSSPTKGAVTLDITLDGNPVPPERRGRSLTVVNGRTVAVLGKQDLLHLITGTTIEDGTLTVTAVQPGARFFTFTYGA